VGRGWIISQSVITCPKSGKWRGRRAPKRENATQVTLVVEFFSIVGLDRTCAKMGAAITASLGSAGYQSEPFCGILGT
jgi:hypothetical protein